jgi:hypothetical protein
VKQFRPFFSAALFVACALAAQVTHAAGVCTDDPERCVQRGSAVARTSGTVALSPAATVSVAPAVSMSAQHKLVPAPTAPAHKPAAKAARPSATTPTPATPGMGMLLKLSAGAPGEVSWFPSRPADNSGASWVL